MCFRPSNSEAKSVVVCPSCGKTTPLDSERCEKCGASLDGSDAPAIAPPQAPAIAPSAIPGRYNLPPLSVSHPELPGASSIRTNLVGSSINDGALWRFLKKGVVARKSQIDCWYSSPVTALIQDPVTKAVVGVEIERNGQKLNIAARNGVVLALGGYENDPNAAQQFLDQPKTLVTGTLYNEGDGMRMAQAAGARLWHTNAWESGGVGLVPEADRMRSLGADIAFFRAGSVVLVGGDARRYLAEDAEQRGGRVKVGGSWVVPARPDANFFVFDEAQRADMENGVAPRPFPNWSVDLSAEVESGKVARADDVPGLAAVLGLDGEALQATIDAYNAAAASGFDALGRQSQNMRAFGNGPYYGVAVYPAVLATQGGPERAANAQVMGASGEPIPHLYAAGECGNVTARNAQSGGNLAECIVFGKIAGEEAATAKDDAVALPEGLTHGPGSGDVSVYDEAPDESGLSSGEAVGVGEGLGGPLWVKVAATGGAIDAVEVLRHTEHAEVGAPALDELRARMVQAGTPDVDAVAGATVTSMGLKEAVRNALGHGA